MIVSIFVDNVAIQIGIFTISSTLLLFCTRPFVKRFSKNDNVVTNANSNIGKEGIVTKEINPLKGVGQIKVNGESWSAKSSENIIIAEGEHIKVLKIDGVKAIVEKLNTKNAKEETNIWNFNFNTNIIRSRKYFYKEDM